MPIEAASYIADLVTSNPASTDQFKDGDNHLRLIKSVLKATFPNLDDAVTLNPLQMNQSAFERGMIMMWGGTVTAIPSGWALCDGGTYARSDGGGNVTVPDLRNKFVYGASADADVGDTGGAATHTHTLTVAGTALTVANLPAHNHGVTDPGHTHGITDPGHTHNVEHTYRDTGTDGWSGNSDNDLDASSTLTTTSATTGITVNSATTGITTQNTGSGTTHTHTATAADGSSLPPYMLLAYIYKL